jgi:hypothetical protein
MQEISLQAINRYYRFKERYPWYYRSTNLQACYTGAPADDVKHQGPRRVRACGPRRPHRLRALGPPHAMTRAASSVGPTAARTIVCSSPRRRAPWPASPLSAEGAASCTTSMRQGHGSPRHLLTASTHRDRDDPRCLRVPWLRPCHLRASRMQRPAPWPPSLC